MNNLALAMIIAALGLGAFWNNHRQLRALREQTATAQARLDDLRSLAGEAQQKTTRQRQILQMEQDAVTRFRAELYTAAAVADVAQEDAAELTPEKEGVWPKEKAYFYLSKQRLRGLAYTALNRHDQLTKEAVMLFGLSPEEENAANTAVSRMMAELRDLEKQATIPTNTPAMLKNRKGDKMSVFVGPIPKEGADIARAQFRGELNQALGEERGKLLFGRIQETQNRNPFPDGRTVTLIREDESLRLIETDGHGSMTDSGFSSEEGGAEIPLEVRHLFTEE